MQLRSGRDLMELGLAKCKGFNGVRSGRNLIESKGTDGVGIWEGVDGVPVGT